MASLGTPWAGHATHQGMPWQAMAHTKACRGKPWHPMGKRLTSVGLAHGHAVASRGTHQGMPWAADGHATNLGLNCSWACHGERRAMEWHTSRQATGTHRGMSWHVPRHAMTSRGTLQGMPPPKEPWHTPRHAVAPPHGQAMAHSKACRGSPWLVVEDTKACHGTHQGIQWHKSRHVT